MEKINLPFLLEQDFRTIGTVMGYSKTIIHRCKRCSFHLTKMGHNTEPESRFVQQHVLTDSIWLYIILISIKSTKNECLEEGHKFFTRVTNLLKVLCTGTQYFYKICDPTQNLWGHKIFISGGYCNAGILGLKCQK